MNRGVATLLVLLVLGSLPTALAWADDVQVNTYTSENQWFPSIDMHPNGDFVVAWGSAGSSGTDSSSYSIQARRFRSDGSPIGSDFQVNSYTTFSQMYPSVGADANGAFVVVWQSSGSAGTDSSNYSIQAQRYRSDGSPAGDEFQVNTYTTDDQEHPSVAMEEDGAFTIAWFSSGSAGTDSNSTSVQVRRFDSNGSPAGDQFQANTFTTGDQQHPSVQTDSTGDFAVVWESFGSAGTDSAGFSIQGRRYRSDGSPAGGEFQVNTNTTNDQRYPSIGVADDGDFVVAWADEGSSGTDPVRGIRAQLFGSDGSPKGDEFQVNTYTTNTQRYPSAAADANGDFIVGWQSFGSAGTDSSHFSVQARRFRSDGSSAGDDFQVNTYTTYQQDRPVVGLADGEFVVIWHSYGSTGTDDLFNRSVQRFGPAPLLVDPELSVESGIPVAEGAGVDVPILLRVNASVVAGTSFSIDYDENCLTFDETDVAPADGIPDAITVHTAADFDVAIFHDLGDTDGELDVSLVDVAPPIALLGDGALITVSFTANPACAPALGGSIVAPVAFAGDPAPTFTDELAADVDGESFDGSVEIFPGPRGDCNENGALSIADVLGEGLEIADDDGTFWADARGDDFAGSPVGCDANADLTIDAGDITCANRLIFGLACGGAPFVHGRPTLVLDGDVLVEPGDSVWVPVSLRGGGAQIGAVAFSLDLAQQKLRFDPRDSDGDGLPDAIRFRRGAPSMPIVRFDADDRTGELDFVLANLAGALPEGLLVEVRLESLGVPLVSRGVSFSKNRPASFGSLDGVSVAGAARVEGR